MYSGQLIQTAINNAGVDDTIYVHASTYFENVNVTKRLTLIGVGKPVVDAGGNGSAITLSHDGIVLDGFTAINASSYWQQGRYWLQGGIVLYSNHNLVINCTASNNSDHGIFLDLSSNNTLTSNIVSNNSDYGIRLYYSNNNTLTSNIVSNNSDYGVLLEYSNNNNLTGNAASNNRFGFYLASSSSNTIANSTMVEDGIIIVGDQLQHWNTHSIDTSNTVNGKLVYYWKDLIGSTVPLGAGQVILANCTNVVVENQNVSDGSAGIVLGFTSNNTVVHNTANSNNYYGILLDSSSNNTIVNNTANSNNKCGIRLDSSSNNDLQGNTASYNSYGISLLNSNNNTVANNIASYNDDVGIKLDSSSNNDLQGNYANSNSIDGFILDSSSNNTLTTNRISQNFFGIRFIGSSSDIFSNNISDNACGIYLGASNHNTLLNNTISHNYFYGIHLELSIYNTINGNIIGNNGRGIYSAYSTNNSFISNIIDSNIYFGAFLEESNRNIISDNYFDNVINAWDNGDNTWNITSTQGTNIIGGLNLGGNYWSDYNGTDADGDGFGDTPYDISGGTNKDYLPLVVPLRIFDTGKGAYPSISGTHNGTITITPFYDINVSKMYTYPCPGTGGHTEYVKIWNSTTGWNVTATWNGYTDDWHNITFNNSFTLYANETYNYTIRTGSYPQIIHEPSWNATGGVITCTEFVDINGNQHEGWIPAIQLS